MPRHTEKGETCKRTDDDIFYPLVWTWTHLPFKSLWFMIHSTWCVQRARLLAFLIMKVHPVSFSTRVVFDVTMMRIAVRPSCINTTSTFCQTISREIYFNYILLGRKRTHYYNDSSWINDVFSAHMRQRGDKWIMTAKQFVVDKSWTNNHIVVGKVKIDILLNSDTLKRKGKLIRKSILESDALRTRTACVSRLCVSC